VPIERCGVWTEFVPAWDKQGFAMHGIVVTPVFELLAYAWADFKDTVWRYSHIAKIE
jgi:hypothetical protein